MKAAGWLSRRLFLLSCREAAGELELRALYASGKLVARRIFNGIRQDYQRYVCTIAVTIIMFTANPYHASQAILWLVGSTAMLLAIGSLLHDHKPWRWFRRAKQTQWKCPKRRIPDGKSKLLPFAADRSKSLLSISVAWKSSHPEVRHKLLGDRFPDWAAIEYHAPVVVGFSKWSEEAWDQLGNWLVAGGYAEESPPWPCSCPQRSWRNCYARATASPPKTRLAACRR